MQLGACGSWLWWRVELESSGHNWTLYTDYTQPYNQGHQYCHHRNVIFRVIYVAHLQEILYYFFVLSVLRAIVCVIMV